MGEEVVKCVDSEQLLVSTRAYLSRDIARSMTHSTGLKVESIATANCEFGGQSQRRSLGSTGDIMMQIEGDLSMQEATMNSIRGMNGQKLAGVTVTGVSINTMASGLPVKSAASAAAVSAVSNS